MWKKKSSAEIEHPVVGRVIDGVYKDAFEGRCVKCESLLYKKIVAGRHFKILQKQAEQLGMSAIATDERLVYFIGSKTGLIPE